MVQINKDIYKIEKGSVLDSVYTKLVKGMEEASREKIPDFSGRVFQIETAPGVFTPDESKISKAIADFSSISRQNTAYLIATAISEGAGEGFLPLTGGDMKGKLNALYDFSAGMNGEKFVALRQEKSRFDIRNIIDVFGELHLQHNDLYMGDKKVFEYKGNTLSINAEYIRLNGNVDSKNGSGLGGDLNFNLLKVKNLHSLNYEPGYKGFAFLTDDLTDEGVMEADRSQVRGVAYFGDYHKGAGGAYVSAEGFSEFEDVTARKRVQTPMLSSENFVSGFPNGIGYMLAEYERINAAEVAEKKYKLEIDDLTVRGSLRVYEMIISQLRGENDNVIFAGMMKVHHIDMTRKIIYLETEEGVMYNPFRRGDILMVQRFNGLPSEGNDYTVIKQYELLVVDAKVGSLKDGEKRLDTIQYTNFVGDEKLVAKGDVLTRVDSVSDSNRKGIIKITTIDEFGAPYLDVIYGLKTDPENATKVRLGRLEGIVTPYWGRLQGYGLMATNAYLKGKFVLQNGDDVQTRFEITDGNITSEVSSARVEIVEENNILYNSSFAESILGWQATQDFQPFKVGGKYLMVNNSLYAKEANMAGIAKVLYQKSLRLRGSVISQATEKFKSVEEFKTVKVLVLDEDGNPKYKKLPVIDEETKEQIVDHETKQPVFIDDLANPEYKEVKKARLFRIEFYYYCTESGHLNIDITNTDQTGFEPFELISVSMDLVPNEKFQKVVVKGYWNGTGDAIVMAYTGDVYISSLRFIDDRFDDIEYRYSTKIEQTDKLIALHANSLKKQGDRFEKKYAKLSITADGIKGEVEKITKTTDGLTTQMSKWEQTAEGFKTEISDIRTTASNSYTFAYSSYQTAQKVQESLTAIQTDINGVKESQTKIEKTAEGIKADITSLNNLIGADGTNVKTWISTSIEAKAGSLTATFNEQINGVNTKYTNLSASLDRIYATMAQNKKDADAAIAASNKLIEGVTADVTSLTKEDGVIANLTNKINEANSSIGELKENEKTVSDRLQTQQGILDTIYTLDSQGNVTSAAGFLTQARASTMFATADNIVNMINVSTEGIKINGNKLDIDVSSFSIKASQIDFTTGVYTISADHIDLSGYVSASLKTGDSGARTVINGNLIQSWNFAQSQWTSIQGDKIEINSSTHIAHLHPYESYFLSNGFEAKFGIRDDGYIKIYAGKWPRDEDAITHQVYLDSHLFLRVKP